MPCKLKNNLNDLNPSIIDDIILDIIDLVFLFLNKSPINIISPKISIAI